MNDYKHFQLFSLLDRTRKSLQPWAEEKPVEQWLRDLDAQMERISTNRFRVAVVGEFKRGKSSLINTLLQREILPADVLPTTATFNRVVYGDEPSACLKFKDGTMMPVPIESLESCITKLTEESEAIARQIEEAVVEFPSMFCSNHVELIDTPGLNDDDKMTEITLSRLHDIDLAIVTISAVFSFSETEAKFVAKLLDTSSVSNVLFAITMVDQIDEKDHSRVRTNLYKLIQEKVLLALRAEHEPDDPVMEKYERLLSNPRIYFLSAKMAQQALAIQNEALYMKSGYRRFTSDLPGILLESQRRSMTAQPLWVEKTVLNGFFDYADAYSRLERSAETLKQFKQWFASTAYSLTDLGSSHGVEYECWQAELSVAESRVFQSSEEICESIRQAWSGSDATPQGRTLALLNALPEAYSRINAEIASAMGGQLTKIWNESSAQCFDELLVSQISLPEEMTELREDVLALCETAKPATELFDAMDIAPLPFRWRYSPIDVVSAKVDNLFLSYALNAFGNSVTACLEEHRAKLSKAFSALAAERKTQMETMVRQVFSRVTRDEEKQREKMASTARVEIAPEQRQAIGELLNECLAMEAEWREEQGKPVE